MPGINRQTVTIANASAYGTGWALDEAGLLTTEGYSGFTTSSASVDIQPIRVGRSIFGAGAQATGRFKVYFYPDSSGNFPTVNGVPDDSATLLPTLLLWKSRWYEVQNVDPWEHGLLPHIRAELELVSLRRRTTVSDDADDGEGGTDTLVA